MGSQARAAVGRNFQVLCRGPSPHDPGVTYPSVLYIDLARICRSGKGVTGTDVATLSSFDARDGWWEVPQLLGCHIIYIGTLSVWKKRRRFDSP